MKFNFYLKALVLIGINCSVFAQNYGWWVTCDTTNVRRVGHRGIQLDNGTVLISGGGYISNGQKYEYEGKSCEIFDPKTNNWRLTTPMNISRQYHQIIKLNDGRVVVTGGNKTKSVEIYDPTNETWTLLDSLKRFHGSSATLSRLPNGSLLIAGGGKTKEISTCELYDFNIAKWAIVDSMNKPRANHTATALLNGLILVSGGSSATGKIEKSCEFFDVRTMKWSIADSLKYPRYLHSAILLSNGNVLVLGDAIDSVEVYNPHINKWDVNGEWKIRDATDVVLINNGDQILCIFKGSSYWSLYDTKLNKAVFTKKLGGQDDNAILVKLNEKNAIRVGGRKWINDFSAIPSNLCYLYDYSMTNINRREENPMNNEVVNINCYPNPFNSSTRVNVNIYSQNKGKYSLAVYNSLGCKVKTLFENKYLNNSCSFNLDLSNMSTGVYFVQLVGEKLIKNIKILYVK
ncbi:MAG: branched-chain amino acid ABC transporter2C amino acid-binding protein [Ignavibacteria bacterium]|nr:MAG: branched-chain amino acid ABC transporter2C amino acid-binding protein [Ignavibacteria bacterium]KAF0161872.1 MAG: branched-chain amino acid ABC transporter2C amino acid-binding protein [Ignavibacteria bacterium]